MRLAIIVVGIAMGISGSAFAGQSHKQAAASTAAVAETPADPCTAPEVADHAISEKGTGLQNGRMAMSSESGAPLTANHAINTKGTGSAGGRMAMDSESGAPLTANHAINTKGTGTAGRMAINTKGTGCNNGKVSRNKHPDLMK